MDQSILKLEMCHRETYLPRKKNQMFEMAINNSLLLSNGHRGALNYFSSQTINDTQLNQVLEQIIGDLKQLKQNNVNFSEQDFFGSGIDQTIHHAVEPFIIKHDKGFQWYVTSTDHQNDLNPISIDYQSYLTLEEAQTHADNFVTQLPHSKKNKIQLAISIWAKKRNLNSIHNNPIEMDLIRVDNHSYLLISELFEMKSKPDREKENERSVYFTHRLMNKQNSPVNPVWIARGTIKPENNDFLIWYILFPMKEVVDFPDSLSHLLQ